LAVNTTVLRYFCAAALIVHAAAGSAAPLKVMTFNIWVGGESGKQPLSQTARVIEASKADVVGLQETLGAEKGGVRADNGRKVAEMLGWNYFDQGGGTAVATPHNIVTHSPNKWGVLLRLKDGAEVWMFNAHLPASPYQPYQLLNIPYGEAPFVKTGAEAAEWARKSRGRNVERLLADLKPALASGKPVFLTGDFNEPSHQDWTERAAKAGQCPVAVEYPTSHAITQAGMTDAFRRAFPDEVARRGNTWTPITRPDDPQDRHDRIDLVFVSPSVKVRECEIVGESPEFADIVVQPYPSDHRAVVATVELP
jgi:endonuclease/exonuclease/phosphatase family metal-dependent hydrolase